MKTTGIRNRIFVALCHTARLKEGDLLPVWAIVVNLILFPSRIKFWMSYDAYDPCRDCIKIGEVRMSLYSLDRIFGRGADAGFWYRVVGSTDTGFPILETRSDEDMRTTK